MKHEDAKEIEELVEGIEDLHPGFWVDLLTKERAMNKIIRETGCEPPETKLRLGDLMELRRLMEKNKR